MRCHGSKQAWAQRFQCDLEKKNFERQGLRTRRTKGGVQTRRTTLPNCELDSR